MYKESSPRLKRFNCQTNRLRYKNAPEKGPRGAVKYLSGCSPRLIAVHGASRMPPFSRARTGPGKRQHHMGGRGIAPLAVALHGDPLVVEVHRQAARFCRAGLQLVAAADDERESGHALNALVGAGHQKSMCQSSTGISHAGEAGHGVDNKGEPVLMAQLANRDVVQQARGGLGCTMQTWVIAGSASSISRMRSHVRNVAVRARSTPHAARGVAAHLHHAVAVGAVRAHSFGV